MAHLFHAVFLMSRDLSRLLLGLQGHTEIARMAAKERRELGLPY
jgi:hypothetical protein